jgi:hypothetical protein
VPSIHSFLLRIRDELIKRGLFVSDGTVLRLTQARNGVLEWVARVVEAAGQVLTLRWLGYLLANDK